MDKLREWLIEQYPATKAESPMEELFWAAWEVMPSARKMLTPAMRLQIKPQATVGPYRADFLYSLTDTEGKHKYLVVEIDGHDFHERTKEQAARDRSRDRWMVEHRYDVIRFTGSEVYGNPFACVQQTVDRLHLACYGKTTREARADAGFAAIRAMLAEDRAA